MKYRSSQLKLRLLSELHLAISHSNVASNIAEQAARGRTLERNENY